MNIFLTYKAATVFCSPTTSQETTVCPRYFFSTGRLEGSTVPGTQDFPGDRWERGGGGRLLGFGEDVSCSLGGFAVGARDRPRGAAHGPSSAASCVRWSPSFLGADGTQSRKTAFTVLIRYFENVAICLMKGLCDVLCETQSRESPTLMLDLTMTS